MVVSPRLLIKNTLNILLNHLGIAWNRLGSVLEKVNFHGLKHFSSLVGCFCAKRRAPGCPYVGHKCLFLRLLLQNTLNILLNHLGIAWNRLGSVLEKNNLYFVTHFSSLAGCFCARRRAPGCHYVGHKCVFLPVYYFKTL